MATYQDIQNTINSKDNIKIEHFPDPNINIQLEDQLHKQINLLCEEERFLLELKEEGCDSTTKKQINVDLNKINTKLVQLRGYQLVLKQKPLEQKKVVQNSAYFAMRGFLKKVVGTHKKDREQLVLEIINTLTLDGQPKISIQTLLTQAETRNIASNDLTQSLHKLLYCGEIFEPQKGFFQKL